MDKLHYTSELYRRAFQYAKGITTDVPLFTNAMHIMMRDHIWQSGWIDQVSGETISAPSLKQFIERHVPKGIGQTIAWTYAALKSAQDLGEKNASEAIDLLNKQIQAEEGETAEAIYRREVNTAVPTARKADTKAEAGAKGGRGNKASNNITSFKGTSATYTLARLKRDFPGLANRVVAGELSANAAALEAGFRKKPMLTCPQCGHKWRRP